VDIYFYRHKYLSVFIYLYRYVFICIHVHVCIHMYKYVHTHTFTCIGAFGGRFDQEIANIHALYKWSNIFERIVLIGGGNTAELLQPGSHICTLVKGVEGPGVSLLPLGCKVNSITTQGLHWDMTDMSLEMGQFISSSNKMKV
jgi:thiamine pyrophosphokinase